MSCKPFFMLLVMVLSSLFLNAQTAADLSAKYPVVSAYQVRPGILLTVKYAEDRQACEMVLERRYSADQTDADSAIPVKLVDDLIEELAPLIERGPSRSRWLGNSFVDGGVTHTERNFENILVEIDGTVAQGDKIIVIRWKKRTCAGAATAKPD